MSLRFFARIAIVALCLGVLGCIIPVPIPGKEKVSDELFGRVIDAQTKAPIEGVKVRVVGYSDSDSEARKAHRPETTTDRDGKFHLPADQHFYLVSFHTPCPIYHFPPTGEHSSTLLLTHPDYETRRVSSFEYAPSGQRDFDIELAPVQ
ncbi:MAG: carboxypeptidase-like regulatory domain-containing protein [Candidatus Hydrogenedentes bacterium]|nr:carboxypeptidase-like regulatory domain-containing protein [Candidatus Hydrogenedentota bacterium]